MSKQEKGLSRRQMLGMAIGLGGFAFSEKTGSVFAQEAMRLFTPPLTSGPFYPQIKPLDQDADLTVLAGKKGRAQGKVIHLTGRVLNLKGEPVSAAKVEIWQADANGRYSHDSDQSWPARPKLSRLQCSEDRRGRTLPVQNHQAWPLPGTYSRDAHVSYPFRGGGEG
ncbi:MAG: hypothetical protein H0U18_01015 [Pyrinomonadaceae bacterium]|nr:hypothetical protein [Pyrinomonadaceae bacterium]